VLISYRARLGYLAIPKTGTTAIETCLRPECDIVLQGNAHGKHLNIAEYRRFIAPMLTYLGAPRIELCAVMREPLDWMRSWYRYRQRPEEPEASATRGISFETFIAAVLSPEQPTYTHYIGSQAEFLQGAAEAGLALHLFRHDDIGAFHRFLEERFARKLAFERLNVSPRIEAPLSSASARAFERHFSADFDLYNSIG